MSKLARRAWFAYFLSAAMLIGLIAILVLYVASAKDWARGPIGGAQANEKAEGVVVDRSGTMLMDSTDGKSELADDPVVRRAMLHILGDTQGYISSYMLNEYQDEMSGYDRITGVRNAQEGEYGKMQLTVSAYAQKTAVNAFGGQKGTIGVYNYKTGEILCMVSFPNYDPRDIPDVESDPDTYEGVYINRFLHSAYAPGSTFKLVTAAAALSEIDGIENRTFHCDGSALIGDEVVICNAVHGDIGFREALCQSCNVAFAQIAQELGADTLSEYAKTFGITKKLHFDGLVTEKGNFDLSGATTFEAAWAGVGQYTDLINPCQYMTFMGAIANGGEAAAPYLVESVSFGSETQYRAKTTTGGRIMDRQTADELAEMMHYNVVNNYGEWYFSGGYAGAKSGTAQRGEGQASNALLAGFVRSEDYPLAFVVIVEGGGAGSTACTPIIRQVLDACIVAMNS